MDESWFHYCDEVTKMQSKERIYCNSSLLSFFWNGQGAILADFYRKCQELWVGTYYMLIWKFLEKMHLTSPIVSNLRPLRGALGLGNRRKSAETKSVGLIRNCHIIFSCKNRELDASKEQEYGSLLTNNFHAERKTTVCLTLFEEFMMNNQFVN